MDGVKCNLSTKLNFRINIGFLQESPEGEAMVTILSTPPLSPRLTFLCETKLSLSRSNRSVCCSLSEDPKDQCLSRRSLVYVLVASPCLLLPALSSSAKTKSKSPYDERRLLEQNKRIQRENNAPDEFPNFVREGFEVKVLASDNYIKADSGLIYRDFNVGQGDFPKDGQQVTFHYIGYNESGRRIDSTYIQGSPARIRMGTNALVPGFEMGIRDMKPGGRRRIIIPPELGPPVGPSTFFSSKQFEVFDVELLSIQNCERRTIIGFYSDVTCS
ncbi:putative peptidylprolyl isomerase [Arabidopsis thaliana]